MMSRLTAPRPSHVTRLIGCVAIIIAGAGMTVLCARPAEAQGTRAGVLLTLPTSTRALGLGDASAAGVADEWALFVSPAQLARVTGFSAGIGSEAYLASTQLGAIAIAVPVWRGTLGVGATMLDYGSVREIAASAPGLDGVETGRTVSAQDDAIEVGYGVTVPGAAGVRAGVALELLRTRIADLSASGAAASLGVAWTSHGGWDFAAAVQHVGPALTVGATSGPLPETWRAAVAAPLVHFWRASVRPMGELRSVRGGVAAATGAAELSWPGVRGAEFTVRTGYTVRDGSGDDRWPLALGAGVRMGRIAVDYAMERFTRIDQVTHRIGLRFARPSGVSTASSR